MLTGFPALGQTDWSKLHHAYGRATDTPPHLRGLLDDDPAARKAAMEHLWSAIIHQGTPWTATGPVALVVAGLLADERLDRGPEPVRAHLLSFLTEVAEAFAQAAMSVEDLERAATSPEFDALVAAGGDEPGGEDDGSDDQIYGDEAMSEVFFARAALGCYRASPAIMEAMLAHLAHADPKVRMAAAEGTVALARRAMPEAAEQIESRLTAMARQAADATSAPRWSSRSGNLARRRFSS